MKIDITKEELEILQCALSFYISHDCVMENWLNESKALEDKLKIVQPERLNEEAINCVVCGDSTKPQKGMCYLCGLKHITIDK